VPTTKIESGGNSEGLSTGRVRKLLTGLGTALAKKRKNDRFYKYQAIFAYDAVLLKGFASMMEYGAQRLNPLAVTEFRDLILTSSVLPNIIIADFVEYGGMVDAIVATIRNNWPVPSLKTALKNSRKPLKTPAQPLVWRSKPSDGWLTGNSHAEVVAGSRHEPHQYLVALWVKGQGTFGVVDFAPVFSPAPRSANSYTNGSKPPADLEWQYGHMYKSNTDVKLLKVPNGAFITGIDVVEEGNHGIVNVRSHHSGGPQPGAAAWSDAATSPWIEGARTGKPVTSIESAAQGNYGVVDFRYALRDP
jgi:hypothetical protein